MAHRSLLTIRFAVVFIAIKYEQSQHLLEEHFGKVHFATSTIVVEVVLSLNDDKGLGESWKSIKEDSLGKVVIITGLSINAISEYVPNKASHWGLPLFLVLSSAY